MIRDLMLLPCSLLGSTRSLSLRHSMMRSSREERDREGKYREMGREQKKNKERYEVQKRF